MVATKRGGRRKNAGRKPKAFTLLKRRIEKERGEDAEYAFSLFAHVMRDESHDMPLRLHCAEEIMNRVWGKAKQTNELTGKDGKDLAAGPAVVILDK